MLLLKYTCSVSGEPSPQTQRNVKSSLPGSVALTLNANSEFTGMGSRGAVIGPTVGASLATVTVSVSVPTPPSSSVTVSVTVNTPLSPYTCVGVSVPLVVLPSPKSHSIV